MAKDQDLIDRYNALIQDKSLDDRYAEMVQPEPSGPTLEEKYLDPFIYPHIVEPVTNALNTIGTFGQIAAAPVNQALRATSQMIQGKPTDETINPILHPLDYANKYGSFNSVMETLPTGNKPISEMLPETSVGSYLSEQFPKASSYLKAITPNAVASVPVDIETMKIMAPSIAKSRVALENIAESKIPSMLNREQLADQIISGHSKNTALLDELKNSAKIGEVKDFFLKHPELNRVNGTKTLDELVGFEEKYLDQYGRKKDTRSGGLISDLTNKQSEYMSKIPVNQKTGFEAADLQQRAIENLDDMNLTHRSRQSAEKFIREEIPVLENSALNKHPIDYADEIRKRSNKLMTDSSFTTDGLERSAQESAAMAMEKASRDILDEKGIGKLGDADYAGYYKNQQNLSNAMRLRDLYSGSRVSQKGVTVPVGGLERGIAREIMGLKSTHIDPFLLDSANRVYNRQTVPDLVAGSLQNNKNAAIVNIPNIQEQMKMQKGLVQNLADYQIPRDSDEILANPKVVLAKLAQVTNDPKIIGMVKEVVDSHPERLQDILGPLTIQFPNIFESDPYSRINGKIAHPDPMIRQQLIHKAYQDVNNSGLTNTEKALLKDGLNRDGSLPKTFR